MKKTILSVIVITFLSAITMSSCREKKSTGDKIEDAVESVADDIEDAVD